MMAKAPKVHILLSTYNGRNYLAEQLDSLFCQTYQNFTLFIRDDGSTDDTEAVLAAYLMEHPKFARKIRLLPNPKHHNLGYMESFWTLLDQCGEADYYAFCDQDDVWLPRKLERGIRQLKNAELQSDTNVPPKPLLYFSNHDYYDEQLRFLHESPTVRMPICFRDVLFYTPAFGFSIIINDSLRRLALRTADRCRLPHDGWVQKLAASLGNILYSKEKDACYRRHSNAVTANNRDRLAAVKNWIQNEILGTAMEENHYVLQRFQEEYGKELSDADQKVLSLFAAPGTSPVLWVRHLFYPHRLRPSLGGELALRICFLLGRY